MQGDDSAHPQMLFAPVDLFGGGKGVDVATDNHFFALAALVITALLCAACMVRAYGRREEGGSKCFWAHLPP